MTDYEHSNDKLNFWDLVYKYGHWLHIPVSAITIILGLSSFLPLSHVRSYFRDQCVLYANIRLLPSDQNSFINIDSEQTSWGDPSECDIPIYFTVVATIHAFIWAWFFLMFRLHHFTESQEIFMLDLSVFANLVTFIVLMVSSNKISSGTRYFCTQLERELKDQEIVPNITSCAATEQFIWNVFQKKNNYYSYLVTSNACSWLMAMSVAGQILLCIYRLFTWNNTQHSNRTSRSISTDSPHQYDNHVSDDEI